MYLEYDIVNDSVFIKNIEMIFVVDIRIVPFVEV